MMPEIEQFFIALGIAIGIVIALVVIAGVIHDVRLLLKIRRRKAWDAEIRKNDDFFLSGADDRLKVRGLGELLFYQDTFYMRLPPYPVLYPFVSPPTQLFKFHPNLEWEVKKWCIKRHRKENKRIELEKIEQLVLRSKRFKF